MRRMNELLLWKSVKYEHVYLHAHYSVTGAITLIIKNMDWHNCCRPHFSLGKRTPDEIYAVILPKVKRERENQKGSHLKTLDYCTDQGGDFLLKGLALLNTCLSYRQINQEYSCGN
jgi:hypothetical protein